MSHDVKPIELSDEALSLTRDKLPGGLLGSDDSETPLTANRNFGRWLFPLGVEDVTGFSLLDSGDGVILHRAINSL